MITADKMAEEIEETTLDVDLNTEEEQKRFAEEFMAQTEEEKRRVRTEYRKLITELEANKADLIRPGDEALLGTLERANRLYKDDVRATQEATLDSRLIVTVSSLAGQKARKLRMDGGFDVDAFIAKVVSKLDAAQDVNEMLAEGGLDVERGNGRRRRDQSATPNDSSRKKRRTTRGGDRDEDEDGNDPSQAATGEENDDGNVYVDGRRRLYWARLGALAAKCLQRAPVTDFMLGPLAVQQKVRKRVERTNELKRDISSAVKPVELKEQDIERQENETTRTVQKLAKLLSKQQAIPFFEFITNPTDYGQTIENLYHFSFLVRDGRATIYQDEDGELLVGGCDAPSAEDYAAGARKHQTIVDLDYDSWKQIVEMYNLANKAPIIPNREKRDYTDKTKWYG